MIISREVLKEYPIVGEGGQGIVYKIDEDRVVKLSENINLELLKANIQSFLKYTSNLYILIFIICSSVKEASANE